MSNAVVSDRAPHPGDKHTRHLGVHVAWRTRLLVLLGTEKRFLERSHDQGRYGGLPTTGVDETTLPGFHLAGSDVAPPATPSLRPGNRAKGIAKKKSGDPNPYDLAGES